MKLPKALRRRRPIRPRRSAQNIRRSKIESLESRRLLAAAPDLVQFAKDLGSADVEFYCAAWFDGCTTQTQLFADGAKDLPFTEVTGSDRLINDAGTTAGIVDVPAWDFPGQPRHEGFLTLEEISQMSGVEIPMSETPSFADVGAQTVLISSPLHLPIDAYDPDGNDLTVTVTVEDPTVLEATVLSGNRSIRFDMEGFGDMVFELFEQRAPRPAGRVAGLAEDGFYDGLTFHRLVTDFVIQGGDPLGNGTGGSDLDDFDDQFHPDLQHNQTGILSFAKSADDTNNSQFFITDNKTSARSLDYNHSVFGVLTEGNDVRQSINRMDVDDPDNDMDGRTDGAPIVPIVISSVDVFNDNENAVLMLKAIGTETVSTNITIRVTDTDGNFTEQTVPVSIDPDPFNSLPYLNPFEPPTELLANQTLSVAISSFDVEGDAVDYIAQFITGDIAADVAIDSATGILTFTPEEDAVGTVLVGVGVFPAVGLGRGQTPDTQFFEIDVIEPPFHRLASPTDVNGDGELTTADAFAVINTLSRAGDTIELGSPEAAELLDVNQRVNVVPDTRISVQDALVVINALERQGVAGGGEPEFVSASNETGFIGLAAIQNHAAVFRNIEWLSDDDDRWLLYPDSEVV